MSTTVSVQRDDLVQATRRDRMVRIPAGEFRMGSESGSASESPVHEVYVSAFWMDVHPVSNADFRRFVAATGHVSTAEAHNRCVPDAMKPIWATHAHGRELHPVVCVSWDDAQAYAAWCGKRLPTEAEWEKAARGTLRDALFPWGDAEPSEEVCTWNRAGSAGLAPGTSEVTRGHPNGYGLLHMTGNVWQWCQDFFADGYYAESPVLDPSGPAAGEHRVRRGGAWNVREAFRLRCANRGAMSPQLSWPNLGFRCAADR